MCRGSLWCGQSGDGGVCNEQVDQTYFEQLIHIPCTATFTVKENTEREVDIPIQNMNTDTQQYDHSMHLN